MFEIKTYNKISPAGLGRFNQSLFILKDEGVHPDAILCRSQKLADLKFNAELKAIGRAGAGVNNIPVSGCTEQGVVVFNTPGANANAVKEMVLLGLLIASRDIVGGVEYVKSLKGLGDAVSTEVEKNKSKYGGVEILGKRLGVVGLGAIGTMVANSALSLGMTVEGHDPFISVEHAWRLSREVRKASSLERMLSQADYVTLHVPLLEQTKGFFNTERISHLKKGATVVNFARSEIVDESAIIAGLESGQIGQYVTDFPSEALIGMKGVIAFPHIGASTKEAEENCARMIVDQVADFLQNGNIKNSVNFPDCVMERMGKHRLLVFNKNVPNMVGQVTTIMAEENLNILEMLNRSRDNVAYTIVDFNGDVSAELIGKIKSIDGVIRARLISS